MTIRGAAVRGICILIAVVFWIALRNTAFAQCDDDLLSIPVSLKPGQVKTPEFTTRAGAVGIEIAVKNVLPPTELSCMMGISQGPQDPANCDKESLIEANWKVWSRGRVVAHGSSSEMGRRGGFMNSFYLKYLGAFKAKKHEKYSLEVDFTKDGSALAVGDPHLEATGFLSSDILDPKPDPDILYTTYLPLKPGHFRSPEFEGHKGLNIVTLSALGRLPTSEELCLFGIQEDGLPKCAKQSVVSFTWTAWSEGKIVAAGTSSPLESSGNESSQYTGPIAHCGGAGGIDRDIGFFKGRKGQKFSIEVDVKKDGSILDIAYPTLSVVRGYPASSFGM